MLEKKEKWKESEYGRKEESEGTGEPVKLGVVVGRRSKEKQVEATLDGNTI